MYTSAMLNESIADVLEKRFEAKQLQNPLYSLRAFARDLGVSSAQLSMVLSKKRGVSAESADKMADALRLNRMEKQYFMNLAVQEHGRSKRLQNKARENVENIRHVKDGLNFSADQFSVISEWYHLAILQVMQLRNYEKAATAEGESLFLAKRLNLTEEEVKKALLHLLRAGAIQAQRGCHVPASDFVMVQGNLPSAQIKKFHRQNIQKALESMDFQDPTACAFKTTLMSVSAEDFSKMNEELGEFCKNLMIKYGKTQASEQKPDQVYILSQQLFKIAEVNS